MILEEVSDDDVDKFFDSEESLAKQDKQAITNQAEKVAKSTKWDEWLKAYIILVNAYYNSKGKEVPYGT